MLCPHCGVEVPDDSRACPKCRAPLAFGEPILAATDVSRDIPRQEQQVRRLALAVFASLFAFGLGLFAFLQVHRRMPPLAIRPATSISQPVLVSAMSIRRNDYASYQFTVSTNCKFPELFGHWQMSGSDARPGTVAVLREADFMKWKQHRPATSIYSGRWDQQSLRVRLPPESGHYYLVFSNTSSGRQNIVADIRQNCGS
jgi:hypothetical protein